MDNHISTRNQLIEAAFTVVYRKGFKSASLTDILAQTRLTKGALYHHFPNKKALGLALLDRIEQLIDQQWLQPLQVSDDPLSGLQLCLQQLVAGLTEQDLLQGCALNNLAQEMSTLDEDFRRRAVSIYHRWQRGVGQALRRGQHQGQVSADIDPIATADFYVAAVAGGRGLAKTTRSSSCLQHCVSSIHWYLDSLRPQRGRWVKERLAGFRPQS